MFRKVRKIFTQNKVFAIKMPRAPEDIDSGDRVAEWARVGALEVGAEGPHGGKYGRHLSANHPSWTARLIGRKIYQYAMGIMREYGNDTKGSKINIRETVARECETSLAIKGMEIDIDRKAVAIHGRRSGESCSRKSV